MEVTMNDARAEEVTPGDLPRVRAATYTSVYSNQVQIGISPWDFQFSFGHIGRIEGKMVVEEGASVVMSPQHAKAMLLPLLNMLIQYEQQYGVINLPLDKEAEAAFAALQSFMTQVFKAIHEQNAASEGKTSDTEATTPDQPTTTGDPTLPPE